MVFSRMIDTDHGPSISPSKTGAPVMKIPLPDFGKGRGSYGFFFNGV
jgi:hypothetical protein